MLHRLVLVVLVLSLVLAGCTRPRKVVLTKEQKEQIRVHVLSEAPADMGNRIDADLDGRIRLLGVTLDKDSVKPGESFQITYYWQCVQPLDSGEWKIFGHLERSGPEQRRQLLDHHPVGELYPINRWQAGEIIRDIQQVHLDSGFPSGKATLWVGIFDEQAWREQGKNDRLRLVNADTVPNDKDNRIKVGEIQVLGKVSKAFLRSYEAVRTEQAPVIDGKLDDPVWKLARQTPPFVQPDGKALDGRIRTRARLAWDDTNLYVAFKTSDDDIWNDTEGRDGELWKQDVVEVYLDPGKDGEDYVEIQVSPTGALFDAWFDGHRRPAWPEAAKRFNIDIQVAVDADGSVNQREDGQPDKSWAVEMAIPFAQLPGRSGPPAQGEEWTLNLFRLDGKNPGTMSSQGAWAPVGGDFHNLKDAGTLTFGAAVTTPGLPPGAGSPALRERLRDKVEMAPVPPRPMVMPAAPLPTPSPAPAPQP